MTQTLTVSDVGRRLAAEIVQPPLPRVIGVPLAVPIATHRLAAIGTTPVPLREQLGFIHLEPAEHCRVLPSRASDRRTSMSTGATRPWRQLDDGLREEVQ
jgi:hypothetical protein